MVSSTELCLGVHLWLHSYFHLNHYWWLRLLGCSALLLSSMSLRMEFLSFSSLSLCFISLNVLTGSFCLPQGFIMSLSCLTFNFSLYVSLNVSLLVQLFHYLSVMLIPPTDPPWLSLFCSCCSPSILIVNMNFPSFLRRHLQLVAFSFAHYSTVPSISPLFWYCTSSLLDEIQE